MLGYAIFLMVLALFFHNGLLLFWYSQDVSIYGRLKGLNRWILDLSAFLFWGVTLGSAIFASFIASNLGVVGIFVSIAAAVVILKDLSAIARVRKA